MKSVGYGHGDLRGLLSDETDYSSNNNNNNNNSLLRSKSKKHSKKISCKSLQVDIVFKCRLQHEFLAKVQSYLRSPKKRPALSPETGDA